MRYFFILLFISVLGLFLSGCNRRQSVSEAIDATPTPVQGQTERNEGNGIYDIYDEELIKKSEDKTILLYFYSDICGECRALQDDIQSNVTQIPENVLIMKVDIDARLDLKDKYNVEKENTLIQIDSKGVEIKRLETKKSLKELTEEL